jgi:hypothetical protein
MFNHTALRRHENDIAAEAAPIVAALAKCLNG